MKIVPTVFLAIVGIALALPVCAQTGSLIYAPPANAVPAGNALVYVILAITLTFLAVRAMHKRATGWASLTGFAIATAVGVALIGNVLIVKHASALLVGEVLLPNPQGGSVSFADGQQTFRNSSGIPQQVISIVPPCSSPNTALQACVGGQLLAANASCDTDYLCP